MLIQLGRFVAPEAMIDLGHPGLRVILAGSEHTAAVLKPMAPTFEGFEEPVQREAELLTYDLFPRRRPTRDGNVLTWSWTANYYWAPPKSRIIIRKAGIYLARISKSEYRLELEVAGATTQYIFERATTRTLEEAFAQRP